MYPRHRVDLKPRHLDYAGAAFLGAHSACELLLDAIFVRLGVRRDRGNELDWPRG
jgi:hypothetical protein